jgi:hypothetical protein
MLLRIKHLCALVGMCASIIAGVRVQVAIFMSVYKRICFQHGPEEIAVFSNF